jgi:alkylhydroperoxidase/carboxymuconolactone decarboxylase family protein YurZ
MAMEKTNEELMASMDEAARQAKEEFDKLPEETRKLASAWIRKWYLKAGYRRLGRIAVSFAKEREKKPE